MKGYELAGADHFPLQPVLDGLVAGKAHGTGKSVITRDRKASLIRRQGIDKDVYNIFIDADIAWLITIICRKSSESS
jgi:hypothetical protein